MSSLLHLFYKRLNLLRLIFSFILVIIPLLVFEPTNTIATEEEICGPRFNSIITSDGKDGRIIPDAEYIHSLLKYAVVYIESFGQSGESLSTGSGVIFDPCGNIVTNNHVVSGASDVYITLSDGKKYQGKIIGTDFTNDIAVVRLPSPLPYFKYNIFENFNLKTGDLKVGQKVFALGNPGEVIGAFTDGIISNLDKNISANSKIGEHPIIVHTAYIDRGSSGGALINEYGLLIGITEGELEESGLEIAIPHYTVVNSILRIFADYYHNIVCTWDVNYKIPVSPCVAPSI
jgi:S1-C subfamily serine protease